MIMKHQNTSETLNSANPAKIAISGNIWSLEKVSLKLHIFFHFTGTKLPPIRSIQSGVLRLLAPFLLKSKPRQFENT